MIRSTLAIAAGFLAGGMVVGLLEAVAGSMAPLPDGVDPLDPKPGEIPTINFLIILFAWGWGALTAGAMASLVARRAMRAHGLIAACILMVGAIVSLFAIPSPIWFWIAGLGVFPLGGWISGAIMERMHTTTDARDVNESADVNETDESDPTSL